VASAGAGVAALAVILTWWQGRVRHARHAVQIRSG